MNNIFTDLLFSSSNAKKISVKFSNRNDWIDYTMDIFNMLITDKTTEYITDAETGELIWAKN